MTRIIIDLPKDLEFMANMSALQWSLWAQKVLRDKLNEVERLIRLKKTIDENSELTEKDVEELTDKINEAISNRD